ncbi:MAG: hypothetical protein LUC43_07740, partial [Burkholderiales bacterium]|nr:hypothetical protein [Burkholderiales bacterium]
TIYGMPIYKNNLAISEQSKALQDKLDSEVNAFQEDEASCSSENFSNLDKEVVALGDSLEKLGDATEAKETTWCTQITKELSQKIHQHFVQCETKGLFPTDKTKCLTEECKTKIAAIEGYPVSEPSCQQNSRQNFFLMPFRYEESLVKTALTTYETKCIEANFLPAESYQGIGVLKKDLGLAEQCASIQDKLISELNSAKVDTDGCSTGLYSKLKDQLKNYDNLLEKLAATSPSARNFKIWRSEIIDGFDNKIESHFVNCEAKGLFPANKSACLSQKCKALEREIQSFPVNAKSCKEDRQQLANETTYKFEIPLVKGFLAKFDQRCIDENIIPAGTVYDHQFLKKDLANAEKTKKIGDQLTEELSNIKENTAGCTTEQFNKLDKELTAYQEGLKEMLVALGEPLDAYWAERLFNTQNNKLVSHFRSCENSHLFPANKDACLSPRCKSRQQQIEALKVNKEDCTHKINDVIASSTYSFEGPLLAGMINEFKTKCKDEDFLPYKRYKGEPLVKSDYLAHENEMRKKIDAMGHNGEKVPNYSKITLLPWKDVVAKVNSLQVNKNDCSFDKSIMPLIIQMDAYEHEWRSAGFELPGDFEELVNKRNQFRKECNEKKPTT